MSTEIHELSPEEEALYEMSDEELEAAFKVAKAEAQEHVEEEPQEEPKEEEIDDEPVETEEIDEDVPADAEQPEEDSDDVDEDVDDTEEDDKQEPSEELDEDKTEPAEPEPTKVDEAPKTYKVKANGDEFDFDIDELVQLAPKAMNYTKKMQEIAPWRKTISALSENGINHDDVNTMIDALKGNKEAIASIVKKAGVDTIDIDTDNELSYTPAEYGLSENQLAIRDLEKSISGDKEYEITTHVVNKQWDDASRDLLFKDPTMIEGLHTDIKSGLFDEIAPIMRKMKVLDGAKQSDLAYYMQAGQQYMTAKADREKQEADLAEQQAKLEAERKAIEEAKAKEAKRKTTKAKADTRKAAAPTKKTANKTITDYLDDENDEAYDEWYRKLQAKM